MMEEILCQNSSFIFNTTLMQKTYLFSSLFHPWSVLSFFLGASCLVQAQCLLKLDDFETNRKVVYTQTDGVLTQNSPNPAANSVNGSTTCAKYVTKAATAYDNLIGTAPIGNGNDYKTGKKFFKLDVYSASPNTLIALTISNNKLAVANAYPTGRHSIYNATTTKTNQWETLTFAYVTSPDASVPGDSTDQINIQFASGTNTGATFYFDNLTYLYNVAANAGADQTFCSTATVVPLKGTIANAPGGVWSSPTSGTFSPNASSANATYHVTPADVSNGSVTLTFSTTGAACGTVTSQTLITLNSCSGLTIGVPSYTFCAGDSLKVNYSCQSCTFTSGNYYIVQLSNASGSFSSSTTVLGSANSMNASGSIACKIPDQPTVGSKYRMRVIATAPSTTGSDNGADITLGDIAYPSFQLTSANGNETEVAIGDTITLKNITYNAASCSWKSDPDAFFTSPFQCTEKVTYQTAGTKAILMKATDINGCSDTVSKTVQVYSCHPVIPANAKIVTGTTKGGFPKGASIWVKSGGSYTTDSDGGNQTIYVATGGSVFIAGGYPLTIYLALLASCDGKAATNGGNVIVYDPNAQLSNIPSGDYKIPCTNLTMQNEIVTDLESSEETEAAPLVFPNPTYDGTFSISSRSPILEITATNGLGQKQTLKGNTSFETDLKGLLLLQIKTEKGVYVQKVNVLE